MLSNDEIIAAARSRNFDPLAALAVSIQESGAGRNEYGDPTSDPNAGIVGPDGRRYCSLGPFQDNLCAGRGLSRIYRGESVSDLFDDTKSTLAFIDEYERTRWAGGSVGEIAAATQRPADAVGYARSVDALYAQLQASSGAPAAAPTEPSCPFGYHWDAASQSCKSWVPGDIVPAKPPGPMFPAGPSLGIPNPLDGVAGAIESARAGASQLAVAAAVIGIAFVLFYSGTRKVVG